MNKKNPFYTYGTEEILFEVAKNLNFDYDDFCSTVSDYNNGRIGEWKYTFEDISNEELKAEVWDRFFRDDEEDDEDV